MNEIWALDFMADTLYGWRVPPLMFMPRRKQPAECSSQLCP